MDLTGFEYTCENGEHVRVTGHASWSPAYVEVEVKTPLRMYRTVRVAAQVRTRALGG